MNKLLLIILLSFCGYGAFAQSIAYEGQPKSIVYIRGDFRADSGIKIPNSLRVAPYFDSTGKIAMVGGIFYYHTGTGGGWTTPAAGSGVTLPQLNDTLTKYLRIRDSTRYATKRYVDSIAATFAPFDSTHVYQAIADSVALRELLSNKVQDLSSPNAVTYLSSAATNTQFSLYPTKVAVADTFNKFIRVPDTLGNNGKVLTFSSTSGFYLGALSVVGSLQSANHSLYISPTTGDVNAQIDTTHSNNWIVPQDFTKITIDTLQAHTSAGGAIRANSGSAVIAWGAGGGQNITFAGYPITNTGDSVLTTNSSGGLLRYDLRGNYKRIEDTTGATGYTTIGSRDKAKDSAINYTNTAITAERTATATLTNKTIIPMTVTAASYTTSVTINADVTRALIITAQAGALLFNAPTGTLYQFQPLAIRIKDDGTARALTWNTAFRASTTRTLPTTTTLSKTMYILFLYNTTDSKWDILDTSDGY